jgi:hypothetical protein
MFLVSRPRSVSAGAPNRAVFATNGRQSPCYRLPREGRHGHQQHSWTEFDRTEVKTHRAELSNPHCDGGFSTLLPFVVWHARAPHHAALPTHEAVAALRLVRVRIGRVGSGPARDCPADIGSRLQPYPCARPPGSPRRGAAGVACRAAEPYRADGFIGVV